MSAIVIKQTPVIVIITKTTSMSTQTRCHCHQCHSHQTNTCHSHEYKEFERGKHRGKYDNSKGSSCKGEFLG
eukprot:1392777-Amorphochlora_amoeboformis.AAC.2